MCCGLSYVQTFSEMINDVDPKEAHFAAQQTKCKKKTVTSLSAHDMTYEQKCNAKQKASFFWFSYLLSLLLTHKTRQG